jgi:nucleotide-binding universal stress UspA family protein
MSAQGVEYQLAIEDFRRARRKASIEKIMAFITGKSADLLSYEEVRKKLKLTKTSGYSIKEIPLDAIIGSVGRYNDFTRNFLPKQDRDERQWAAVKVMAKGEEGLPPIEVFQIGDAYFVLDGNHSVSVARQLGATHIEAHVNEIRTAIPLTPDVQPDDLIIKAEYAEFLQSTHLDELRSGADLTVTAPGKYRVLEEHIAVYRYVMEVEQKRKIPYSEAVTHWYDDVYLPIVSIIHKQGILRDFPNRTATDLYLWISEHRAELEEQLGWNIPPEAAASDFVRKFSRQPKRIISRVKEKLSDVLTPDELEWGPPTGQWRKERMAGRRHERLFSGILVSLTGHETGWCALDQAIEIARHEEGQVYGLHLVPSKKQKTGKAITALQAEFDRRCQSAGVQGKLAIETGETDRRICDRARWTDLVVLHLAHPPGLQPIARLRSSFRTIIRRCPRPILAVPKMPTRMNRLLLAYDGSPKAIESLYVSAYLAGRWNSSLVVVSVKEERVTAEILSFAKKYLNSRHVKATFVQRIGAVSETILRVTEEHQSDLIIIGGYGYSPVVEVVIGSTLDHVLRHSQQPMLICR